MSFMKMVLRPVARPMRRCFYRAVGHVAGLMPMDQFDALDIFIAGYPKSGNTWFQNLLAGIVHGVDASVASNALVQELVPDVHQAKLYRRFTTPSVFKTHHLPRPEYKRVVYLLRDGRDAMVSYYHFLRTTTGKPVDWNRMIVDGEGLYPCRWHEHARAWMDNPFHAEKLLVRYEDLKLNPVKELRRFCEFSGMQREDVCLERAAHSASFENMRQREQREGLYQKRFPKGEPFVRRGQVGSFRDEMPPDVLKEFMLQAGEVMEKCGYH